MAVWLGSVRVCPHSVRALKVHAPSRISRWKAGAPERPSRLIARGLRPSTEIASTWFTASSAEAAGETVGLLDPDLSARPAGTAGGAACRTAADRTRDATDVNKNGARDQITVRSYRPIGALRNTGIHVLDAGLDLTIGALSDPREIVVESSTATPAVQG